MSQNAKNLSYDAKEPAFLQRLRGHYGNTSGSLERPISQRPRRPRDVDDDDSPTYVDAESNEVISKKDYEAMVNPVDKQAKSDEVNGEEKPTAENGADPKEAASSKQNLAEIGGPRKRKQAKVVADVADEVQEAEQAPRPKDSRPPKTKKKKKIKLSFEE
ncbi:hypothetical protein BJX99DRAFT_232233 [Aspergillus californicus]